MSTFNTSEMSIKDGSCKDLADLNYQIWSFIHHCATNGCVQNLRDFKFHSREISWLSELSFQSIINLSDPTICHFRIVFNKAEIKSALACMTSKSITSLSAQQDLAYRYFMQLKLCCHKYGNEYARARYGLNSSDLEFMLKLTDAQIRHLVTTTSCGKLTLRFDPQIINGIGKANLLIEALSRIQLQCLNSAAEI